jgi:hypothetical protein
MKPCGELNRSVRGPLGRLRCAGCGGHAPSLERVVYVAQVLPDGKHVVYTVLDPRTGHHRARVLKFGEPETTRELLETDSRVLYSPSVLTPDTGYLLFVRGGNILAQPFDLAHSGFTVSL